MRDRTKEMLDDLDEMPVETAGGVDLKNRKTLVLNADFQPLKYFPLSLMSWKPVMEWIAKGIITGIPRINVISEYDDAWISTPNRRFYVPSVVAHLEYIPPPKKVAMTKFNVFLRDDFTCQYSGDKCDPEDLTWDHVVPRDYGGRTTWGNIATSSRRMNEMKANRTPKEAGLHLLNKPYRPSHFELLEKGRKYPPKYLHESWVDYLYWSTPIGEDED